MKTKMLHCVVFREEELGFWKARGVVAKKERRERREGSQLSKFRKLALIVEVRTKTGGATRRDGLVMRWKEESFPSPMGAAPPPPSLAFLFFSSFFLELENQYPTLWGS